MIGAIRIEVAPGLVFISEDPKGAEKAALIAGVAAKEALDTWRTLMTAVTAKMPPGWVPPDTHHAGGGVEDESVHADLMAEETGYTEWYPSAKDWLKTSGAVVIPVGSWVLVREPGGVSKAAKLTADALIVFKK